MVLHYPLSSTNTCTQTGSEKMNEDRPYFEARGIWKKVKGDSDYDDHQKLANLSLMWEKMVGNR